MKHDINDLIERARKRKQQAVIDYAKTVSPKPPDIYRVFVSRFGKINVYIDGRKCSFTDSFQGLPAYKTAAPNEIEALRKNSYVQEIKVEELA